jgi:hypothetical protein
MEHPPGVRPIEVDDITPWLSDLGKEAVAAGVNGFKAHVEALKNQALRAQVADLEERLAAAADEDAKGDPTAVIDLDIVADTDPPPDDLG